EQAEQAVLAGEPDAATRLQVQELLPRLRSEADEAARHRAMLERLDGIRFVANDAVTDDDFDRYLASRRNGDRLIYSQAAGASQQARAFRDYGIDVETLSAGQAATAIGKRPIRGELVTALDDWLRLTDAGAERDKLLQIARLVDPEPTRDRLRLALAADDGA